MTNQREVILRVSGLKQYFKLGSGRKKSVNRAVDDISFEIYKGEVFSLVGESGCGKTTTGRSIIKLYQTTGGEVYFHGTRIVSDVKAAKEQFLTAKEQIEREKSALIAPIKEKLSNQQIDKNEYTERLKAINESFIEREKETIETYRTAKLDRKFERIIDEKGKKARKSIKSFPEYNQIQERYVQQNASIVARLKELEGIIAEQNQAYKQSSVTKDKEILAANKQALMKSVKEQTKLSKELKLNDLRKKQDIQTLKYNMIHRNRLLMRKMQMIFQDPIASLNPRMTVKEIIAEGLRINGIKNEKEIEDRVNEALKIVGLVPEHASRYPHEFSGGQRQRIGIARALVVEPSFIIADEPISALDVSIRAQVINLLNELRETRGITIMFIAHDLSVVKYFSDRLAVMYYGRIVEMGDKEKIFTNPLHPYTLSLMDSIPLPDPQYEKRRGRTVRYNPAQHHDYSKETPTLREVEPGHIVLCNTDEFNVYKAKLKA